MRCEDRGPDLLARALGQVPADTSPELEAHLAACTACRIEADACAVTVRASAPAAQSSPAGAPADLRRRILDAVRDDAGERRAAAAVDAARSCPDVREDIPLLVLGQLDAAERAKVEAHASACGACADERDATERLVSASRRAMRDESAAELRTRVLAAVRGARTGDVPPPPPSLRVLDARSARRRAWRISMLVPLSAAAALLAAIAFTAPAVSLHVQDDSDARFVPRRESAGTDALVPDVRIARDTGEVSIRPGEGIASGDRPVSVRMRLGGRRAAAPGDAPGAGEVRLRLQPHTRLIRRDDEVFELVSGRLAVHAGRLEARFTIRHGRHSAAIVGTRFEAAVVGSRLVVSVAEGRVDLGTDGGDSGRFGAGEDGLAGDTGDAPAVNGSDGVAGAAGGTVPTSRTVLLRRRSDGTPPWEAFLAPVATLAAGSAKIGAGDPLVLEAALDAGPAGAVTILVLEDSDPRFLVRLKGPDGLLREVKVERSMVDDGATAPAAPSGARPSPTTVRLEPRRPYRLRLRIEGLSLEPGRWEASLRYQSYGGRGDRAEWHGSVESAPIGFEVTPR